MKTIDELRRWYEENATRREYTLIKAKLDHIQNLYKEIEYSEEQIFLDEIIGNFSDILELHREVIADKELEIESLAGENAQNYIGFTQGDLFQEKKLEAAFAAYLTRGKKKPLSSYTINDYCSRIRNLWKAYAGEAGETCGQIQPDSPLVNAAKHIEQLQFYVRRMGLENKGSKNWANIGAALNKFEQFLLDTQ